MEPARPLLRVGPRATRDLPSRFFGRDARLLAIALSAVAALTGSGCHERGAKPLPTWAAAAPPYVPSSGSGNAFDGYALAALGVEQVAGKELTRVYFYPAQKDEAMKICASAVAQTATASRLPCDFHFVVRPPFSVAPYQKGWRLIGRVLRWKVERACEAADFDTAIDNTILATRFGFDLTGGGATDASLGLSIVDEARIAIASYLPKMGAEQLERLAAGVEEALAKKPPLTNAIEHEGQTVKLAVQSLQDASLKGDFSKFSEKLGPGAKEAIAYLADLSGNEAKRATYFQQFAAEGDAEIQYLLVNAPLPTAKRSPETPIEKHKERPWKHFAHHFFTSAAPLIQMNDRTVARTKLLILNAMLIQSGKVSKSYPGDLRGFAPELVTDPYSGLPFPYHADPAEYSIYSVGQNLRDDAGDTDDSFTSPDLKLELKE